MPCLFNPIFSSLAHIWRFLLCHCNGQTHWTAPFLLLHACMTGVFHMGYVLHQQLVYYLSCNLNSISASWSPLISRGLTPRQICTGLYPEGCFCTTITICFVKRQSALKKRAHNLLLSKILIVLAAILFNTLTAGGADTGSNTDTELPVLPNSLVNTKLVFTKSYSRVNGLYIPFFFGGKLCKMQSYLWAFKKFN